MLWGRKNETFDETKHSIAQPPPTPGLASWAFNSLFNRQTPSSKYANMAKYDNNSLLNKDILDENKEEDTFYNRKSKRKSTRRALDDSVLNSTASKNVAWGGNDFRVRTRSSSFTENTKPNDLNDYFKEKELLPDAKDIDFDFSKSTRRRSNPSYTRTQVDPPISHSSLPEAFPGKFPSPYVQKNSSPISSFVLSSSASKNLKHADYNTQRNRRLVQDYPLKKTDSSYQLPKSISKTSEQSLITDDFQQDIFSSLDKTTSELNNLILGVEKLKADGSSDASQQYHKLEKKYEDVKQELITELKKSKKMYDSYYKFMDKYKELKQSYSLLLRQNDSKSINQRLERDLQLLTQKNDLLENKIELNEKKWKQDDTEIFNLKTTLQNSSKFEVTLRRKVKYLENKIDENTENFKKERFNLNEKIFLLESKLKDEEDSHKIEKKKLEQTIQDLEKKLESWTNFLKTKDHNLSITPEYGTDRYSRRKSYDDLKEKKERDDTFELLNERYRGISNKRDFLKRSPDKNPSSYRRPSSMQVPSNYKLSDLNNEFNFDSSDKLDESTSTFDLKDYKRRVKQRPSQYGLHRHSINGFSDLTFNASEL